jgi:hypothetical protein
MKTLVMQAWFFAASVNDTHLLIALRNNFRHIVWSCNLKYDHIMSE